jgi:hypothetical protein
LFHYVYVFLFAAIVAWSLDNKIDPEVVLSAMISPLMSKVVGCNSPPQRWAMLASLSYDIGKSYALSDPFWICINYITTKQRFC